MLVDELPICVSGLVLVSTPLSWDTGRERGVGVINPTSIEDGLESCHGCKLNPGKIELNVDADDGAGFPDFTILSGLDRVVCSSGARKGLLCGS